MIDDEFQEFRSSVESNGWTAPIIGGYPRVPVVDTLPTPAQEFEGELRMVRAVVGVSAAYLAMCLGSAANPTTYSWVTVATG